MRPELSGIGERIKARRLELGLSQRATTAGTSISYAYLSRIEAGSRHPSLSVVIELAERLDTTAQLLVFGPEKARCPFCGRAS